MPAVRDADHFSALVKELKAGGSRVSTNSILMPAEIDALTDRGRLSFVPLNTGLLFLIRERDFNTVYYYLDAGRLAQTQLDPQTISGGVPLVLNRIYLQKRPPQDLEEFEALFVENGFRFYQSFKRLTLDLQDSEWASELQTDNPPRIADQSLGVEVMALWRANLDVLSAPLPFEEGLRAAIEREEIPVVRDDSGRVIAAMQYARKGRTAIINHVVVAPEFRRRGLAAAMLRQCFAHSVDLKQVALWVADDNVPAETLYRRFGFSPDGKVSRQLLWQSSN